MSELDTKALEGVRALAQGRVDRIERQKRLAPIRKALLGRSESLMTSLSPSLVVGPMVEVRQAILNLETSDRKFPERMAEQERKYEAELARVRRRTAALQTWLEAIS